MLIEDQMKQLREDVIREMDRVRQEQHILNHRIDGMWWKVGGLAVIMSIAIGKIFGNGILSWVAEILAGGGMW